MKTVIRKSLRTTKFAKSEDNPQKWYLINADGKVLGRLSSKIAKIIIGKNNPQYTPNTDTGDNIIVINAKNIVLTGKRSEHKEYLTHSRYPGGQKRKTYKELMISNPEKVITLAVKRMLPKNRLGSRLIHKLKVYKGSEHPHTAQKPLELNI
jgi:large subunit ribosomal protein L13